jgi:hypothetical protein
VSWTAVAEERIAEGTLVHYGVLIVWATGSTEVHAAWGTPVGAQTHAARFRGQARAAVVLLHLVHVPAGP